MNHISTGTGSTIPAGRPHLDKRRLAGEAVALTGALLLCSCGGGGSGDSGTASTTSAPSAAPASVERNLLPSTVNAAAVTASDTSSDYHVVINPSPSVAAAHRLFVFLPGTGGVPDMYRLILRAGATRGYHAIGLDYPNPMAVGVLCSPATNAGLASLAADVDACFLNVRKEIITGQDLSPFVAISDANSIRTRLTQAIAYLSSQSPTEGWGQYLVNGVVDWSKIVVGGHSQGGGHAGLMAKLYPVGRACYFASPPDWNGVSRSPAAWEGIGAQDMTAASKQFGFAGLQDPSVPYSQLSVIWQAMGLGSASAAVLVDSNPAFAASAPHTLTTNAQPTASSVVGQPLHGLTVRDAFTPLDASGHPLFDAQWGYLCFS